MKTVLYREVIEAMRRCVADFDHLESIQESESDDLGNDSDMGDRSTGSGSGVVPGDGGQVSPRCPHNEEPSECDACFAESDFQADCAREQRHFGS